MIKELLIEIEPTIKKGGHIRLLTGQPMATSLLLREAFYKVSFYWDHWKRSVVSKARWSMMNTFRHDDCYVSGERMATVLTTETGIQSVLNRVKFYLNPALGHLQQIPNSQVTPCFQYLPNVEAIFRVIE